MKIQKIEISNVLGLARADIDTSRPITVIAGNNEAGKSTIADAVSMAILGQPKRVKLKKELEQLLHEGEKKGRITLLDCDGESLGEFKLPGGQHVVADGLVGADFLPYVLEPSLFASLDAAKRRSLLFSLTKCKASPDATEKMLLEAGIEPLLAAEIKPFLRSGFPGACEEAKTRTTEQKGVWKSITGEAWGSQKGEGWEPESVAVEVDQQQIDDARTQVETLAGEISEAQTTLGEKRQQVRAAQQAAAETAQLNEQHELLERRKAKLEQDEKHLAEWQGKLSAAREAASGESAKTVLKCPCCSEKLEFAGGELVKHNAESKVVTAADRERVTEYEGYVHSAERAVANSKRDVAQSEAAGARLEQIAQQQTAAVSEEAIQNAEKIITELKQAHAAANARYQALNDAQQEAATRQNKIDAAAAAHRNIMAWLAVAEQLAPDGIPSRILASAIAPVNESLAVLASRAFWKKTQITSDMEITCNGRLYGLMSESAKWRADTLIALAIAQISGLRLVVLDRFDVLDSDSRIELLDLLKDLASADAMDTMIMCGTMRAMPDFKDPNIGTCWVANGIAES